MDNSGLKDQEKGMKEGNNCSTSNILTPVTTFYFPYEKPKIGMLIVTYVRPGSARSGKKTRFSSPDAIKLWLERLGRTSGSSRLSTRGSTMIRITHQIPAQFAVTSKEAAPSGLLINDDISHVIVQFGRIIASQLGMPIQSRFLRSEVLPIYASTDSFLV